MKKRIYLFILISLAYSVYARSIVVSGMAPREGKYIGIYSLDGKEILPAKYGYIYAMTKDYALVANLVNGKCVYGVIDHKGKEIIPFIYDGLQNSSEGLFVAYKHIEDAENGRYRNVYQLFDSSGKALLDGYDYIQIYADNYIVSKNEQWGVLDKNLNSVIPLTDQYSHIRFITENLLVAKETETFKQGLITISQRMVTPFIYNNIIEHSRKKTSSDFIIEIDHKFGLLDTLGNELIPPLYEELSKLSENIVAVRCGRGANTWGLFNINQPIKEIVPCRFANILDKKKSGMYITDNYLFVQDTTLRAALYDFKGNEVIPYGRWMNKLQAGYWEVSSDYSKWGVVDNSNKEIITPIYHQVRVLTASLFRVSIDGRYGIADLQGNIILPVEFDSIKTDGIRNVIKVFRDDVCQLYDLNGIRLSTDKEQEIIGAIKSNIDITNRNPTIVSVGDKWQVFDDNAKTNGVLYTHFIRIEEGAIIVEGYRYGVIDTLGNVLIPAIYRKIEKHRQPDHFEVLDTNNHWRFFFLQDGKYQPAGDIVWQNYNYQDEKQKKKWVYMSPFTKDLYLVSYKNEKYGLINKQKKTITSSQYDNIREFSDGLFKVEKDGKYGIINEKGKVIVPTRYREINLRTFDGIDYLEVLNDTTTKK